MSEKLTERIDALKVKEAALIDEASAEDFKGKVSDIKVQLDGLREQRQFLESQVPEVKAVPEPAMAPITNADAVPDVPVKLSEETEAAQEELEGRINQDRKYKDLLVQLEAEGGLPDQETLMVALGSDVGTEYDKVPVSAFSKAPAVTIKLGAAKQMFDFLNQPGGATIRDYLDLKLAAYTTTTGTAAGALGDTIPTLIDSQAHQIDLAINGFRRVPGVQRVMTNNTDEMQWPVINESGIGTIANNLAAENTTPATRLEGHANVVQSRPREFAGYVEVSKNILTASALTLIPVIREQLTRSMARISERAFAEGTGFANAQPDGLFRNFGSNVVQAAAAGGHASANEILGLPKELGQVESDLVWAVNHTNWYDFIRTITQPDVGYVFADNTQGVSGMGSSSIKLIDGRPCYFFTYAPDDTTATDYYLALFVPSAAFIHEYSNVELTRDDSIGRLQRRTTFLITRWADLQWYPDSAGNQARTIIQGKA